MDALATSTAPAEPGALTSDVNRQLGGRWAFRTSGSRCLLGKHLSFHFHFSFFIFSLDFLSIFYAVFSIPRLREPQPTELRPAEARGEAARPRTGMLATD